MPARKKYKKEKKNRYTHKSFQFGQKMVFKIILDMFEIVGIPLVRLITKDSIN
jgi:hypothetical protein